MTALMIPNIKFDAPQANHWIRGFRGSMGVMRDWFDPGASGYCPGRIKINLSAFDSNPCNTCYRVATVASDGADRWARITTIQDIDGEYEFTDQHFDPADGSVIFTTSTDFAEVLKNGRVECRWLREFTAATHYVEATEYSDSGCSTATGTTYTWDTMEIDLEVNADGGGHITRVELDDSTGTNPTYSQMLGGADGQIVLLQTVGLNRNDIPALGHQFIPEDDCQADGTGGQSVSGASTAGIVGADLATEPYVQPIAAFYKPGTALKRGFARLGIAACGGCESRAKWLDDRAEDMRRFFNGLRGRPAGV